MDFSFGINNFDKYWESTKEAVSQYLSDCLNEELALTCAQKLWHMCDWYYKENEASLGLSQCSDLQGSFGAECNSLRVMRDVCNGAKHAGLEKTRTPIIRRAIAHKGAFSSGFSRGFDVSVLEIELVDGTKVYFDDAAKEVLDFWVAKVEP